MISELRQQVDGKEGKFVKVTGRSKTNNSHDRTKKSKSSEENSHHDRPFSSSRNNAAEMSGSRQQKSNQGKNRHNSKVSQNQPMKSRSLSADPHSQSQWLLRRPDRDVPDSFHRHHPRDSWDSDSDISDDDSWTLEPETARSGSRDSRSRSRSQVREPQQRHGASGQGHHRYSGVTHRDRPR